jgi:hypothetical protein
MKINKTSLIGAELPFVMQTPATVEEEYQESYSSKIPPV